MVAQRDVINESTAGNNTVSIKRILEVAMPDEVLIGKIKSECVTVIDYFDLAQKLQSDNWNLEMSKDATLNDVKKYHEHRAHDGNARQQAAHTLIILIVDIILVILVESAYFKKKLLCF